MRIKLSVLACLLLPASSAWSHEGWIWDSAGVREYAIEQHVVGPLVLSSYDSAHLAGLIQHARVSSLVRTFDDCQTALKQDGVQLRFYFPDMSHEVTQDVAVQYTRHGAAFSYSTPALSPNDINTLSVLVTALPKDLEWLEQQRAKFQVRLHWVNRTIKQQSAANATDLQYLLRLRQTLQAVIGRLSQRIDARAETVAVSSVPLQVDNNIAGPAEFSTVAGAVRLSVTSTRGSAIQGETTTFKAAATAVCEGRVCAADKQPINLSLNWRGIQVSHTGPLPASDPNLALQFTTGRLKPDSPNDWAAYATLPSHGHGKSSPFVLAMLMGNQPVAADLVPPTWRSGYTPDATTPFVQSAPPVNMTVSDAFGLIDDTSFDATVDGMQNGNVTMSLPILPGDVAGVQAVLTTFLANGTTATRADITSSLAFLTADGGRSFHVEGDLNIHEEGIYALSVTATDLAGNVAAPGPLVTSFVVDKTAPEVQNFAPGDGQMVNMLQFVVSARVNEPLASLQVNGVSLTASADRKTFSLLYMTTIPGTLELSWVATDLAGNVTAWTSTVQVPGELLDDTASAIPPDQGLLEIKIFATQAPPIQADELVVDICGVSLLQNANERIVNNTPVLVNFGSQAVGTRTLISNTLVPPGAYTGVRLRYCGTRSYVELNGSKVGLQLPASVDLPAAFTVRGGVVNQVQVALSYGPGISTIVSKGSVAVASTEAVNQAVLSTLRGQLGSELDAMLTKSDYVVRVTAEQPTYRTGTYSNLPMIFTEVPLSVNDRIKLGDTHLADHFNLELLGGIGEKYAVLPAHMPLFGPNEPSVLFLKNYQGGLGLLRAGKVNLPGN